MILLRISSMVLGVSLASIPLLASEAPILVTRPHAASVSASGNSSLVSISPDGRYVLIGSVARNIATNDDLRPVMNLYAHDRLSSGTILVSRDLAGIGGGNGDSGAASVSTNGLVAFVSVASNLVSGDTNTSEDVFVHDLNTGTTRLISSTLTGFFPMNPSLTTNLPLSEFPLISRDGRFVAFESRATNLVAFSDTNNSYDVFVYDTLNASMTAVSGNLDGTAAANGTSRLGAITPDGRAVAFTSTSPDLVADGPANQNQELYVRDTVTGQIKWLSSGVGTLYVGTSAYRCFYPALSADAASVIFKVAITNATNAAVILCGDAGCAVIATNSDLRSVPQISADGISIAYDDGGQLFRNSDLVSVGSAFAHSPVMTPDGSKIAYLASSNNNPAQIYFRDMTAPDATIVTVTASGLPSGRNHDLAGVALNADGTCVAFDSVDDTLVSGDLNDGPDVFLREVTAAKTYLLSTRHSSVLPSTARGSTSVNKFAFSADASKLVFTSFDGDVAPGDTNRWTDAFVRDLQTGAITSLSDSNGVFLGDTTGLDPVISGNGRYVAFSRSSRFSGSSVTSLDLIRKDLQTGAETAIQSLVGSGLPRLGQRIPSAINASGGLVAYIDSELRIADVAAGTNRLVGAAGAFPLFSPDDKAVSYLTSQNQLAIYDLAAGTNVIVGPNAKDYAFSADSRYVVYGGSRYDRVTGSNIVVCTSCRNLSISGDGRLVAYEDDSSDLHAIRLHDMEANTTTLLSQNAHGTNGNGSSTSPVITHDGAFVVFASRANDLVADDNNGTADIFVRDLRLNKTLRIRGQLPDGPIGAGHASNPVLAPDGRTLAFQSFSARMVPNDFDNQSDIFVLRLGGGDLDNDALPDDWEVAYFGDLNQNGSGDYDQDGSSNAQEYVAGTDPTNQGSVLRVLTLMSSSTGQTQLFWSAVAGKTYRVEYKTNLDDSQWTPLPELVTAIDTTPSVMDQSSGFNQTRFYRVVAVD